jgi:hypothetical protein
MGSQGVTLPGPIFPGAVDHAVEIGRIGSVANGGKGIQPDLLAGCAGVDGAHEQRPKQIIEGWLGGLLAEPFVIIIGYVGQTAVFSHILDGKVMPVLIRRFKERIDQPITYRQQQVKDQNNP